MKDNEQRTSAVLNSDLFDAAKIEFARNKFTLRKLLERSLYLYLTDEDFRTKIKTTVKIDINEEENTTNK